MRVISADGEQLGIMSRDEALRLAEEKNLDLVCIAPKAEPPVCKILDYGKYKYDQAIKAKQARKNQSKIETKEMKFRPKIDVGDYETKKNHVMRFLRKGARVKITIMFRGREMAHTNIGEKLLLTFAEECSEVANMEKNPKLEGRFMAMFLTPKTSK